MVQADEHTPRYCPLCYTTSGIEVTVNIPRLEWALSFFCTTFDLSVQNIPTIQPVANIRLVVLSKALLSRDRQRRDFGERIR